MRTPFIAFPNIIAPERLNILVVDDESAVAATIQLVLRHLGHTVDVLCDGAEAFARLALFPNLYDVLVTDHAMRELTGLQLVARLRGTGFRGGIAVVSASVDQEEEKEYLALGAGMIVRKPFEMSELRHAMEVLRPLAA